MWSQVQRAALREEAILEKVQVQKSFNVFFSSDAATVSLFVAFVLQNLTLESTGQMQDGFTLTKIHCGNLRLNVSKAS